jgi:hypothetical protein|tara:strand:+ start:2315 stop:3505 length:1191 start_codon:yes stop_codon:yes gene_type:complete
VKSFPNGFIENETIYRNAWGEHPARIIGIVKNVDFSIAYFESNFEKFKSQVDMLIERIDQTENRGSFLNKAKHLKATLPELKGLGDFQALDHKISDLIELILKTIKGNRTKNAEIKGQLIRQIKAATDLLHWGEATTQILSIQKKWFHTGPAKASKEARLNEEFKNILNSFFDQKKFFYDDKNNLIAFYERKYEALIQEAKKLESLSEDQKLPKLESLKIAWKENGIIKKIKYDQLKKEFDRANKPIKVDFSLDQVLQLIQKLKTKKEISKSDLIKYRQQLTPFNKNGFNHPKLKLLLTEGNEWLDLSEELLFVEGLCQKKHLKFHEKSMKEQMAIKVQITHKLLKRDQSELKTLEDNSIIFNSKNSAFSEIVAKKIKSQKNKIKVKKKLLLNFDA